jgi:hypothetical protein
MPYDERNTLIIASISLILFIFLSLLSLYHAIEFWDFRLNKLKEVKYASPRFVFFVVLGISAALELPRYIGCINLKGPYFCYWVGYNHSFDITYEFHLVALCGYTYSIITTSILWSDTVQGKDGKFWFSSSPLDFTKIFFRVAYVLYCFTNAVMIIMNANYIFQNDDETDDGYSSMSYFVSPIFLFLIATGCFCTGIRLQLYVIQVKLGGPTQFTALMRVNIIMALVVSSYFLRALLLLSYWDKIPDSYVTSFQYFSQNYPIWMPLTQWFPFIICSTCLIYVMKLKKRTIGDSDNLEDEKDNHHQQQQQLGDVDVIRGYSNSCDVIEVSQRQTSINPLRMLSSNQFEFDSAKLEKLREMDNIEITDRFFSVSVFQPRKINASSIESMSI